MKKKLYTVIVMLLALLALLLAITLRLSQEAAAPTDPTGDTTDAPVSTTQPSQATAPTTTGSQPATTETTTPPTSEPWVPPTTEPTAPTTTEPTVPPTTEPTTPPTTEPAQPSTSPDETFGIGLYTWQELVNMSTVKRPYGPGVTSDGIRPIYAEQDQVKYGQYAGNFIAPDNGCVYLTFDCGYEYYATDADGSKYPVTERILDVLKEKNVKAVFFITMYYAQSQPELVQRMIDEGHTVGNHSNNHPVMPDISIEQMIHEVMSLHEYVLEHFGYEMTLFRPPTGAYSVQSLAVVQNLGYKNVHWSFAYADYNTAAQPSYKTAMETATGRHHSGAIYLLHAVSETNAAILGDLIDFFWDQGYTLALFE